MPPCTLLGECGHHEKINLSQHAPGKLHTGHHLWLNGLNKPWGSLGYVLDELRGGIFVLLPFPTALWTLSLGTRLPISHHVSGPFLQCVEGAGPR